MPKSGAESSSTSLAVRDSITFDVFGAGFVAEAGNERGAFERNFALRSIGSGERLDGREFREDGEPGHVDDFGHGGHGFWLQGSQVALRDNVAAGHRHHGFAFWNRSLVDRPLEGDERIGDRADEIENFPVAFVDGMEALIERRARDGLVPASHLPLIAFENNTAFTLTGSTCISTTSFGPTGTGERRRLVLAPRRSRRVDPVGSPPILPWLAMARRPGTGRG